MQIEFNILKGANNTAFPYFTGDFADCPPLPRVGEMINVANRQIPVISVVHIIDATDPTNPGVNIVVTANNN